MSKAKQRAKEYAGNVMLTVDHRSDVEDAYLDTVDMTTRIIERLETKNKE